MNPLHPARRRHAFRGKRRRCAECPDHLANQGPGGEIAHKADEITAIRNELGLEEVHILGHSWGGTVALEYLLTAAPTGVLSVTLVGPLVGTDQWLDDANILVEQLSEETQAAIHNAVATGASSARSSNRDPLIPFT